MIKHMLLGALTFFVILSFASAVSIESVTADTLKPSETGDISITIENVFSETVKNVVLELSVANLPLNVVGSSSFSVEEIDQDDDERFSFKLRAAATAEPGEYQIPYTLRYTLDNQQVTRQGSVGVKITADSIADFTAVAQNPIIDQQGTIEVTIINKGLGELRFATIELIPSGFTLLSEQKVYIGDIDSDDFEIASFDVIFTHPDAAVEATVEYRDVENRLIRQDITLPLTVYTRERALELGIIQRSNAILYITIILILIVLWIVIRMIRKRRRLRNSTRS